MKRFLITAFLIATTFGFANAQAKQKVLAHKTTSTKAATLKAVSPTATTTAPVVKTHKKSAVATVHAKADGAANKRFKENNKTTTVKPQSPVKKDGTADRRYKANKKK